MRTLGLALILTLLLLTGSHAGPNEGGALNVQGNVDGVDTNGDPCTVIPIPANCFELVNVAQPDANGVEWFVVVATSVYYPLSFNTITFGLGNYETGECYIGFFGPCVPEGTQVLEIPSEGWPGPNTGTSVSWAPDCLQGEIVPIYYFGIYVYGGGGTIPLADAYPGQPAAFVSCDTPPEEDPVIGFNAFYCGETAPPSGTEPICGKPATRKTTWGQIKNIYRR